MENQCVRGRESVQTETQPAQRQREKGIESEEEENRLNERDG